MAEIEPTEVLQVDEAPRDTLSGDDTAAGTETETEKEPGKEVANGVKKEPLKENVPPKRSGAAAPARRL